MKKILSCIVIAALTLTVMAVNVSAAYTLEDAEASDKVYRGTPSEIKNGIIDPIWDKAVEYELEGRLPAAQKRTRPGLRVWFKHLWDDDNFYYLVKVSGDKDIVKDGNTMIGSFYADKTNLLLVTPVALEDEEHPEYYYPSYGGRKSDVSVKIHRDNPRTAPESGPWETSEWIMPNTWGNNDKDLIAATNSVIPKILESLSIYETGDSEETFYIQAAIPWVDKNYAKDGNIVGIDVSYEDNMYGDLADYLGLSRQPSCCYYAENYGESVDNPLFAEPRVLSSLSVNLDKDAADVISSIKLLDIKKISIRDRGKVNNLWNKYEKLSDSQKELVYNFGQLKEIKARIDVLVSAKDAGRKVAEKIEALPYRITLQNEAAVREARKAYDALNADQKSFVNNLNTLQKAESEISRLKGEGGANGGNFGPWGEGTTGDNINNSGSSGGGNAGGNSGSGGSTSDKPGNLPITGDPSFPASVVTCIVLLAAGAVMLITKKGIAAGNSGGSR